MTTYMGTKDNIFKTFLVSILGNIKYFFTCSLQKENTDTKVSSK